MPTLIFSRIRESRRANHRETITNRVLTAESHPEKLLMKFQSRFRAIADTARLCVSGCSPVVNGSYVILKGGTSLSVERSKLDEVLILLAATRLCKGPASTTAQSALGPGSAEGHRSAATKAAYSPRTYIPAITDAFLD
jgi:hypothetical protein